MYKKFPGADKIVASTPADAPASVQSAIRLMYVGAVVEAVYFVVSLASLGSVKTELHNDNHKLTTAQINSVFEYLIVTTIIFGLIGIALWIFMARGAGQGRRWSQIVSTVLFALYSLETVLTFTETRAIVTVVFVGLTWLIGAATIFMLWRPDSKAYFSPAV
jgi:tryptophan-rich sensory protein